MRGLFKYKWNMAVIISTLYVCLFMFSFFQRGGFIKAG